MGEYDNTNLGTVHLDLQEESEEESMGNYEEIDDDDKVGPFILHNQYSILRVHCHRDGTSYHDHKPLFSPFYQMLSIYHI